MRQLLSRVPFLSGLPGAGRHDVSSRRQPAHRDLDLQIFGEQPWLDLRCEAQENQRRAPRRFEETGGERLDGLPLEVVPTPERAGGELHAVERELHGLPAGVHLEERTAALSLGGTVDDTEESSSAAGLQLRGLPARNAPG